MQFLRFLLSPFSALLSNSLRELGPLGLEPTIGFYATDGAASTSVICPECGAARALHIPRSGWLDLSSIDPDLLSVVLGWEEISKPIRDAILTLIRSAGS